MTDTLRRPFLIGALVCAALLVLVEVGGPTFLGGEGSAGALESLIPESGDVRDAWEDLDDDEIRRLSEEETPPGLAIRYMAFLDGILLFTLGLMGLSLVIGERRHMRLQGILTLVFSLVIVIVCFFALLWAFAQLMLMLSLFLAVPFGTIAYMGLFGFFDRPGALAILSLALLLRVGFVVCLVLAQQRFLLVKRIVALVLTTFLGVVVIGFLHGLVPTFLVSITDAVAALVVGVLAILWALVLLISSIVPTIRALRPGTDQESGSTSSSAPSSASATSPHPAGSG